MSDKLMTPAAAAERLKVSRQRVYQWIASGELPATKLGPRATLVSQADVDALRAKRAGKSS